MKSRTGLRRANPHTACNSIYGSLVEWHLLTHELGYRPSFNAARHIESTPGATLVVVPPQLQGKEPDCRAFTVIAPAKTVASTLK